MTTTATETPYALRGLEPLGPLQLIDVMSAFMPQYQPHDPKSNIMIGGLYGKCWLVAVDGKRLLQRPRETRNVFGKVTECILYHDLDTETYQTHHLHKMIKLGCDWTTVVQLEYSRLTFCIEGVNIEFIRKEVLSEVQVAERELNSVRGKSTVTQEDEEIATLSAICTVSYALTRQASRLAKPTKVAKVRGANVQKWEDGSFSRRKANADILQVEWRFNDWKSCSRRVKESIIQDGITEEYGKAVAERYYLDPETKKAWREVCKWDAYSATMRMYRHRLKLTPETILMFPELAGIWDLAEAALEVTK